MRHRNRAVTRWDYERLVLESFPQVFKVKCLPHTDSDNELAPGHVKLVAVPDWRKRPTGNPLQPKATKYFLRQMEAHLLAKHTSAFSVVHVVNPTYETLLVDSKVQFNEGFDPGFFSLQLKEELRRFLSPWAYDTGEDIVFGGKVHASEIMAFIEGREYVDHITNFELYHRHQGIQGGGIGEMQIGVNFLISETPEAAIGGPGVGKTIGLDFVVGSPGSRPPRQHGRTRSWCPVICIASEC